MRVVDISAHPRIPVLLEMARRMSRAKEPDEVLRAYIHGMHDSYGSATMVRMTTLDLPPGRFRLLYAGAPHADDHIESPEEWLLFPVQEGGFLSAMTRTPEPKLVTGLHLEQDPILGEDFSQFRGALAVPAYLGGQPAQWLVLLHEDEAEVTVERLEDLVAHVNLLYSNIRTAVLARQLRAANRWIQHEVQTIADIQRALLPGTIPSIAGLEGAAHYETFDRSGGDYYDFRPLAFRNSQPAPEGPWAVIVADAAGHGPAAAVVMAMMRTLFQSCRIEENSPGALLETCNQHLHAAGLRFAFVTAFAAVYDPIARVLRYARAGHEPPLLVRGSGGARSITHLEQVNGFPLGIGPGVESGEAEVALEPGDTLVLYTDGITEARSPSRRQFGVEGIEDAARAIDADARGMIAAILRAVHAHESGIAPQDDQTLLVLRVVEP